MVEACSEKNECVKNILALFELVLVCNLDTFISLKLDCYILVFLIFVILFLDLASSPRIT